MRRACLVIFTAVLGGQLLAASSCSEDPTLSAGDLAGPVALATATRFTATTGENVVFVANADGETLRVFVPSRGLFERGPNAVSPLAIELGFRPEHLASGTLDGPTGPVGFVAASGAAAQVALVDTQTSRRTRAAVDVPACSPGLFTPSCLPSRVLDVAVGDAIVYALLDAAPPATQAVAVLQVVFERQANLEIPVLKLDRTIPVAGAFGGLAVSPDNLRLYLADRATPRVVELTVADATTRDLTAAGPVRDVVPTPAYLSAELAPVAATSTTPAIPGRPPQARPAGEYLLAILLDGTVQTLDPVAGAPARDPLVPADPIAPLSIVFGTPIRDLTFVPCPPVSGAPCRTTLATSTTNALPLALLGFVALGDGRAAAIVPDAVFPWVFRPIDLTDAGPSATPSGSVTIVDGSVTDGITTSDTYRATFKGVLPGHVRRSATLLSATALADPGAGFDLVAAAADQLLVTRVGAHCAALAGDVTFEVTAVTADELAVASAVPLDASCFPIEVVYTLRAGTARPWVVTGTLPGFLGRTDAATPFEVILPRMSYPVFPSPFVPSAARTAVSFIINAPADVAVDTTYLVTTSAEYSPFFADARRLGLANAVAALSDRLFVAVAGGGLLVERLLGSAAAPNDYR